MSRSRRARVSIASAVGIVVLAVAAVGAWALLRDRESPSDVVRAYFDGKSRHDCSYIDLLSVERTKATDRDACERDTDAYFRDVVAPEGACAGQQVELSDERVDGDEATVDYVVTHDDAECRDDGTVHLLREDDRWKDDHL